MNRIRTGVIGVGYLGRFHAQKYAALSGASLAGVADVDKGRAQEIAEQLKTEFFPDPLKMIGKVDAVSIVVPTELHHRVAKPFLEQGIHVLLEKPVTVTVKQADELIELADRKKLVLQIGHIERFNPALTALRPLIKAPKYLFAERAAPFTVRCTDVSVVLDLMIHDLDIAMDLAGSAPRAVSSAGTALITDKIDMASARILFENGCVADVVASRVSDEKKRTLRVQENDRVYLADYQTQQTVVLRKSDTTPPGMIGETIAMEKRDTLADEIQAFVTCVQQGLKPLVSGVEGRRALALATLIEKNILEGRTEFVPLPA
jgi:predicted dehydrogenase